MHPAHVVHLAHLRALGNLDAKVGQRNVGAVHSNQLALAVLTTPPAPLADDADGFTRVVAEVDRAGHATVIPCRPKPKYL